MKRLWLVIGFIFSLCIPGMGYALDIGLTQFVEGDGAPAPYVYSVIVPNGTLIDNLDGTVTFTPSAGSGATPPSGSTTYIQYNNAGVFGAEAAFTYTAGTDTMVVVNIDSSGTLSANLFTPDAADGADIGSTTLEFSDIYFADGSIIYMGDDQDVSITHVPDTGILVNLGVEIDGTLNADGVVALGDGGDNFSVASDGIDIDTSGNITNAGTIGSGAVTSTGAVTGASLTDGTATINAGAITGVTSLTFTGADADPNAAGEIQYDSTVSGMLGGALRWFDNDSVRIIVDLEADPADDDFVVAYDSTADGFYMKADADSGATAWDDIADPDADATIAFAGYEQTITTTLDEADHVALKIDHTDAEVSAATTLFQIQSVDDGEANLTYIKVVDDTGVTPNTIFTVGANGDVASDGTIAASTLSDGTASLSAGAATGLTALTFTGADADPNAAGEIQYDSTVSGMLGGALRWFDNDSVRILVDLETDPADDDYVVAYDADADGFYMKADSTGTATAWDDIADPDADATIAFAGYEQTITTTLDEADHVALKIDHTDAEVSAATTLFQIQSVDDGEANLTYIRVVDDSGVSPNTVFSVGANGAVTSDGAVTGGTVTDGTVTLAGDGTITGVSAGGLPDNIVDNGMMADDAIDSAEIADGAIDTAHIADAQVTVVKNAVTMREVGATAYLGDGGTTAITTGAKYFASFSVPFNCDLKKIKVLTPEVSGDITIDVWVDTFANWPPDDSDSLFDVSNEPTIADASSDNEIEVTSFDDGEEDWDKGDVVVVNVDSVTTLTQVMVVFEMEKED